MKRFALLLLAFTMLFVMASAEESFVEEDFAAAASFDDEFFAEEAFFGDEFEADQPEVEDEVEDRSVYLFEDEVRPEASKLAGWQKWEITMAKPSVKKNKVSLSWTVAMGEDASGQPSAQPTKKQLKQQKGVKIFVYQVDPITGVATQVKKPLAVTKNKVTVTVKNSGTYYYFARFEKVDKKTSNEDLGKASNRVEAKVELNNKAVSKVKAYASFVASEQPSEQSAQPLVVAISVDLMTKEAADKYEIVAAQKKGDTFKGTYVPTAEVKDEVQGKGYISIKLAEGVEGLKWDKAPKFEAGKKVTVSVKNDSMKKAKKGSVTPKAISIKTQPEVKSARQIDAKTLEVTWYDVAAKSGVITPAGYKLAVGKDKIEVKLTDAALVKNSDGSYTYNMALNKSIAKLKKAKTLKVTVQSDVKKAKKSKAYKFTFTPANAGAILNLKAVEKDGAVTLTWSSTTKANFEVYATDSKNTKFAEVKLLDYASGQPSEQGALQLFSAEFAADELKELNKGYRLSFTVKAVDGTKVIAREVKTISNPNAPSAQPSEQSAQK